MRSATTKAASSLQWRTGARDQRGSGLDRQRPSTSITNLDCQRQYRQHHQDHHRRPDDRSSSVLMLLLLLIVAMIVIVGCFTDTYQSVGCLLGVEEAAGDPFSRNSTRFWKCRS